MDRNEPSFLDGLRAMRDRTQAVDEALDRCISAMGTTEFALALAGYRHAMSDLSSQAAQRRERLTLRV